LEGDAVRAVALLAGVCFAASAWAQTTVADELPRPILPFHMALLVMADEPELAGAEPAPDPAPPPSQEPRHAVPKELSDKVREFASHNDFAKAIALITEALAKDSGNAELYRLRATLQCRAANMKLCLEDAGKAVEADMDYAPAHLFRGLARIDAGQPRDALTDCEATVKIWSDQPQGYNCRGLAHRALREYEIALADFDGALAKDAKFSPAPYNKGITYVLMSRPDEAIASFSSAIVLNEKYDEAFAQRGKVRIHKGDVAGGRVDFAKALSLNGRNRTAAVGMEALQVGEALDALAGKK
jgi:tetratricopeptide (TPR) repeat protein